MPHPIDPIPPMPHPIDPMPQPIDPMPHPIDPMPHPKEIPPIQKSSPGGSPPYITAPRGTLVFCLQTEDTDSHCQRKIGRQMALDLAILSRAYMPVMPNMPDLRVIAVHLENHRLPEAIAALSAYSSGTGYQARFAARVKKLIEAIKLYEERRDNSALISLEEVASAAATNEDERELRAYAFYQQGGVYRDKRQQDAMMDNWGKALTLTTRPELRARIYIDRCSAKAARPSLGDAQGECDNAMSILKKTQVST